MAPPKFDGETFRRSVLGAGAGVAMAVVAVGGAQAEDRTTLASATHQLSNEICLPLREINGISLSSDASARERSMEEPGTVAISTFPGADVTGAPTNLTNMFRNNRISADCYLNDSYFADSGTVFSLYVAGNRVEVEGENRFGILDLQTNPEIIRSAVNEARLAKAALASADDPTYTPASFALNGQN